MSLGLKFFIIQIAVLVLFTTDRLIIIQLLGPEYVVPYDVVFKIFSILTIGYGIISAPLWTSYSDAFHQADYSWIIGMMNRQLKIVFLVFLGCIVLSLLCPAIIELWLKSSLSIDFKVIIALGVFTFLVIWNNVFAMFLNGINETKLQIKTSIIASLINIPLSIFFTKYFSLGIEGIVLGTIFSLSIFSIFGPYEVYKILKRKRALSTIKTLF